MTPKKTWPDEARCNGRCREIPMVSKARNGALSRANSLSLVARCA